MNEKINKNPLALEHKNYRISDNLSIANFMLL